MAQVLTEITDIENTWMGDPPECGFANYVRKHGQPMRITERTTMKTAGRSAMSARVRPILPRRLWRYPVRGSALEQLRDLSPRQRWIAEQSTLRWERNHNAGEKLELMRGEVGEWCDFTIRRDA